MRFLTAGESHGPQLTLIIDDVPAGIPLTAADINQDLQRRQVGYGRGGRMQIETDAATITSGVRCGKTTGGPIALTIPNKDFAKWTDIMAPDADPDKARDKRFIRPRPGHADLAGYYKYDLDDLRDALERASARETAARVAAGGIAKALLNGLGIQVASHVTALGPWQLDITQHPNPNTQATWDAWTNTIEGNDCRIAGTQADVDSLHALIDTVRTEGNTLGGTVEVMTTPLPPGLGSYAQWDRKLDGQLAQAVMSVQAVKAVAIGRGDDGATLSGKDFHDPIVPTGNGQLARTRNHAGGLEAGVTNGMPLLLTATMKPIATLRTALPSVNLDTGEAEAAHFERADVTAVPACGVVCEAMVALTLARAVMDTFGRDTLGDIQAAHAHHLARCQPAPTGWN